MFHTVRRAFVIGVLGVAATTASAQATNLQNQTITRAEDLSPAVRANFGHLPLGFEKNVGQTSPDVQWLARTADYTLFLAGNEATVQINHLDKISHGGVGSLRSRTASLRMAVDRLLVQHRS